MFSSMPLFHQLPFAFFYLSSSAIAANIRAFRIRTLSPFANGHTDAGVFANGHTDAGDTSYIYY